MKIKFFSLKFPFPDIHDNTHAISVCSGLQSQCEAHGLLRRLRNNFLYMQKTFVPYLLYQHSQYAAFDRPNNTDVMIVTLGKSVTRTI